MLTVTIKLHCLSCGSSGNVRPGICISIFAGGKRVPYECTALLQRCTDCCTCILHCHSWAVLKAHGILSYLTSILFCRLGSTARDTVVAFILASIGTILGTLVAWRGVGALLGLEGSKACPLLIIISHLHVYCSPIFPLIH